MLFRPAGHIAGKLVVPKNIRMLLLLPYRQWLNPAEHQEKFLREDCFANMVFADLAAVDATRAANLRSMGKAVSDLRA